MRCPCLLSADYIRDTRLVQSADDTIVTSQPSPRRSRKGVEGECQRADVDTVLALRRHLTFYAIILVPRKVGRERSRSSLRKEHQNGRQISKKHSEAEQA